jgi:hypothetical protein
MYLPSMAPGTIIGQIIFSLDKGPVGFMYTGFYRKRKRQKIDREQWEMSPKMVL